MTTTLPLISSPVEAQAGAAPLPAIFSDGSAMPADAGETPVGFAAMLGSCIEPVGPAAVPAQPGQPVQTPPPPITASVEETLESAPAVAPVAKQDANVNTPRSLQLKHPRLVVTGSNPESSPEASISSPQLISKPIAEPHSDGEIVESDLPEPFAAETEVEETLVPIELLVQVQALPLPAVVVEAASAQSLVAASTTPVSTTQTSADRRSSSSGISPRAPLPSPFNPASEPSAESPAEPMQLPSSETQPQMDAPMVSSIREVTASSRMLVPAPATPVTSEGAIAATSASTPTDSIPTSASAPVEKIAATPQDSTEVAVKPLGKRSDYKFLTDDVKRDTESPRPGGIGTAKSRPQMHTNADFASTNSVVTELRTVMDGLVSPVNASPVSGASVMSFKTEGTPRIENSTTALDAAGVVREVAELTHDFRLRERSSVEVKFNFKDDTELSVRLAYRDGEVQTTFRTDSEALRTTLSREWQGHAASFAQESRGHRVADPVFTHSGDLAQPSQNRDAGASTGGDARQHSQSSHPDNAGDSRTPGFPGAVRSTQTASSTTQAVATRLPTDRLLHAFA